MSIKRKTISYRLFIPLIFLWFFSSTCSASAATINFSPASGTYHVGDSIRLKVTVSSDTSINAVSGHISFPTDLLSLSSVSKNGSIINLWAQEPSYSNASGTVSFEGVILNGYSGDGATVITLIFRAKSTGTANFKFTSASILANDGNGTEVISGKGTSSLNILEAVAQPTVEKESPSKPQIEAPKSGTIKIIEVNNHTTDYSWKFFIILLIALLILIITFIILYEIYYLDKLQKKYKNRLINVEQNIVKDFDDLESDMQKGSKEYTDIKSTETKVINEIENLENEL